MFECTLQNTTRKFTHFPSNGGHPATIDLTFTRRIETTIVDVWSCDTASRETQTTPLSPTMLIAPYVQPRANSTASVQSVDCAFWCSVPHDQTTSWLVYRDRQWPLCHCKLDLSSGDCEYAEFFCGSMMWMYCRSNNRRKTQSLVPIAIRCRKLSKVSLSFTI